MKTIKFLDNNTVALKDNDSIQILEKAKYTRYYDKGDKRFNSWPKFTTINNETYV